MKQELIDFLKSLGWAATQIASLKTIMEKETIEAADKTALDTIKAEVNGTVTALVLADDKNVKTIQDAARGRAKNEAETLVKKVFALTDEEMKDKKLEDVVVFAHQKLSESAGKDKKELLDETVKQAKEIKELKEVEIPKIRGEVDLKLQSVEDDNLLIADLNNVEKRKIMGKAEGIKPAVIAKLDAMGIERKRVDGKLTYVIKATGLPVKSADGTRLLDNDDIVDMILDELGLKVNSEGDPKPPVIIPKNEEKKEGSDANPHLGLSDAEAQLAELKLQSKPK